MSTTKRRLIRFDPAALLPADILAGRNLDPTSRIASGIRKILGSYTNHNALILNHSTKGMCVGDTTPPYSSVKPLTYYEDLVNLNLYLVRFWRVRDMTMDERQRVSDLWQYNCDHVKYPERGVLRLWIFRLVNHLPWEIPGQWCTKNTLLPFSYVLSKLRDPRRRPDGQVKLNPTPRTMENRLVAGVLEDITERVIVPA